MKQRKIVPDRVIFLVEKLSFPRVTGSEGENRAFAIIEEELNEIGIEVKYESFSSEWMELKEGYIEIGGERLDITPLINSIWSNPWMPIPQHIDMKGILTKPSEFYKDENERKIIVNPTCDMNNPCLSGSSAQLFTCPFDNGFVAYWCASELIPSASIDPTAIPLLEQNIGSSCRFYLDFQKDKKILKNMVTEIQGGSHPDQIVVVGAHIDSFPGTVGANDNASGCARLVEFARYFVENPPSRTIRFVWFTGEELDRRGSRAYVNRHSQEKENICFYMNVDGGVAIRHGAPAVVIEGDSAFIERMGSFVKGIDAGVSISATVISRKPAKDVLNVTDDRGAFNSVAIPTIYVGSKKIDSGPNPHLPTDTIDKLDPEKIRQIGSLALSIIEKAAE
jgi:hypothetical protein